MKSSILGAGIGMLVAMTTIAAADSYKYSPKKKATPAPEVVQPNKDGIDDIILNDKNLVVMRGEVNSRSVSQTIESILASKSSEIYLYINSPGGSVFDGVKLASAIMASDKKIHCIADVAASMATIIFEVCDTRYVTRNSIVMQHEALYGVEPQSAPNAHSFFNFLTKVVTDLETAQAERIGISYADFKAKVRNDWWTFGTEVIKEGLADKLADIKCTRPLMDETYTEIVNTFFGPITLEWSKCPLLTYPKGIIFPFKMDASDRMKFELSLDIGKNLLKSKGLTIER